ncbi:DUF456 domain-containing protein [Flavobacteriaceae bacterium]|jgi:uncharacterized protein YqgC (DUF456 family)|nr:DUF456 domain-containing protein [Flavobacteriaceae bacterium]MDA9588100.1 DUF456 domain-containing protein [Flavobacteriaceae bacterium]MDA9851896.1 DUF456 domain-containing protein [Flavobacteriaceae bacterium]MDC0872038.1 DUF456 domain-containing protein [Flavobacteriaceae bacterium]MDC3240948.1 DUF456 domain-containing protein [Flavobacteriaceae bacterium]
MDLLLIGIAGFFIVLGIAGSFLPIIPGPITSWLGLLILNFAPSIHLENRFLIISFCIALAIFILDNFIPVIGAKKFGGGRGSVIGSALGLLIGILFLGPFGILLGPFFGALFGELILNFENKKGAFKAALGALIGFFTGVFLKLIIGLAFAVTYFQTLWKFREVLL